MMSSKLEFYDCYQNYVYRDIIVHGKHNTLEKIKKIPLDSSLKGKKVLDLGCAEGYVSLIAADLGAKVVAIDSNEQELKILAQIKDIYNLAIEIHNQDFFDFKMEHYDVIFCLSVLHLSTDPISIIKKIAESCQEVFFEVQLHQDNKIKKTKDYQEIELRRHLYCQSPNRVVTSIGTNSFEKLLDMNFKQKFALGKSFNERALFRALKSTTPGLKSRGLTE